MNAAVIPLGTVLKDPWGLRWTVGAVTNQGGERYYMLTQSDDSVSLMPAFVVEDWDRI